MSDDRRPRPTKEADAINPSMLGNTVARIAELTSVDVAVALATQLGGRKIYVPTVHGLRKSTPLVRVVGMEAAKIISEAFGMGTLLIPSCRAYLRYVRARQLRRKGLSVPQISRLVGVSEGRVQKLVQGVPKGADGSAVEHADLCPTCGAARRVPL
jgi:hypothetical protein